MKTLGFALALAAALAACGTDSKPCDPTAPDTICSIAGSGPNEGYSGDNGLATKAVLYYPMDSIIGADGNVWFIDFNNYVVREIDKQGIIHTIEGNGQLGDSPSSDGLTQVPALMAYNNHTTELAVKDGYLYLAAWHESRVKRVDLTSMMMENYAGAGVREAYTGDNGPALTADIDLPSSIAWDPAGDLVLMDQGNQVVRKIDSTGTITTIAGMCVADKVVQCAAGEQPVQCPTNERYYCGGDATQCMQRCNGGYGGDGGPALQARFNLPYGQASDPAARIAYDKNGDLLISDTGNNRIRKVDHTTGTITTIAGTGTAGYSGDGGPAATAQINHPVDIAVGDDNSVYFTDVYNHCIRKIDPSGTISDVVGKCHFSVDGEGGKFEGDGGAPADAQLNRPYGLDVVGNTIYVSDTYNNRLRVANLP